MSELDEEEGSELEEGRKGEREKRRKIMFTEVS